MITTKNISLLSIIIFNLLALHTNKHTFSSLRCPFYLHSSRTSNLSIHVPHSLIYTDNFKTANRSEPYISCFLIHAFSIVSL